VVSYISKGPTINRGINGAAEHLARRGQVVEDYLLYYQVD